VAESLEAIDAQYEVLGTLGRGAAGVVFRGRERATGREVALKCLLSMDERSRARFAREGHVAASLNHPGILKVHRVGTLDGHPCLAYELVPGARPLDEAFSEQPLEARLELLVDAGDALGHAHEAGLVHRDVKGANLLVDEDGRLRVADFGLATGASLDRLTCTGAIVGTPLCMAPEQIRGEAPTAATDVWALGVLLYEALTGGEPFAGHETLMTLSAAVLAGNLTPPTERVALDPALEAICLRALSLEARARHPNGTEFAEALRSYARGEEAPARRLSWVAAGALSVLVLAGLALASAPASAPASAQNSPPTAREGPSNPTLPPSSSPAPTQGSQVSARNPWAAALEAAPRWKPEHWTAATGPPPPALLGRYYPQANDTFKHILGIIARRNSASEVPNLARLLLQGGLVARDRDTALAWLRWGVSRLHRASEDLLLAELAREEHPTPAVLGELLALIVKRATCRAGPQHLRALWDLRGHPDPQMSRWSARSVARLPPFRRRELASAIVERRSEDGVAAVQLLQAAWLEAPARDDKSYAEVLGRFLELSCAKAVVKTLLETKRSARADGRLGEALMKVSQATGRLGRELLLRAAQAGDDIALRRLAAFLIVSRQRGGVARRVFGILRGKGPEWDVILGDCHLYGIGNRQNRSAAKACYERAFADPTRRAQLEARAVGGSALARDRVAVLEGS
jgi:serine/threonine protein kinase